MRIVSGTEGMHAEQQECSLAQPLHEDVVGTTPEGEDSIAFLHELRMIAFAAFVSGRSRRSDITSLGETLSKMMPRKCGHLTPIEGADFEGKADVERR